MKTAHRPSRSRRIRGRLVVAVAAIALLAGCGVNIGSVHITGSGHTETRTYDLAGFQSLAVSHTFSVAVTRGDAFSVSVTADDNVFDDLVVEKQGTQLRIGLRSRVAIIGPATLEATVTMPALSGVDLSGASRATLSGFTSTGTVALNASGASSFSGDLGAGTLNLELSGASRADVTGQANSATLRASGASRLSLSGLVLKTATVDLSGASTAEVNVTGSIDRATVSGASRLIYGGGGTLGSVTTSGASSISQR
jgi:hypothetical protein